MVLNLTIVVALVFFLQYGVCVAFYHANERRTMVKLVTKSIRTRVMLKISAWCLLILSMFLCASLQGWERGIPVWLCMIAVAGFASLYVSAYKSLFHIKSGLAAAVLSILLGVVLMLIDTFGAGFQGSSQQMTVSLAS